MWFKQEFAGPGLRGDGACQPAYDAELALDHLVRGRVDRSGVLDQQMVLIDHLSPAAFAVSPPLSSGPPAGSESAQFRQVQRALGLARRGVQLYHAFHRGAGARGDWHWEDVYRDSSHAGASHRLAEALVDISEGFWRPDGGAPSAVVERTIGQRPGKAA